MVKLKLKLVEQRVSIIGVLNPNSCLSVKEG
jgi:hypothetical protein